MSRTIQLRNVPDLLHQRLKTRATLAGMSLSDYLVREIRKIAERPTLDEIKARLLALSSEEPKTSPTLIVREERGRR
jgi:plasmid stability protein